MTTRDFCSDNVPTPIEIIELVAYKLSTGIDIIDPFPLNQSTNKYGLKELVNHLYYMGMRAYATLFDFHDYILWQEFINKY